MLKEQEIAKLGKKTSSSSGACPYEVASRGPRKWKSAHKDKPEFN